MVTIPVSTSDSVVWDIETVIMDICHAMANNNDIIIDLLAEGPDLKTTGLYDRLVYCGKKFNYNLSRISIRTDNKLEQHSSINICYYIPIHFAHTTKEALRHIDTSKDSTLKHFGIFIGRSNAPRLILANYLHQLSNKTVMSYHYSTTDDFHMNFIGLEDSIKSFNVTDVSNEASFIAHCPIKLDNDNIQYPLLGVGDKTDLHLHYANFFVEIVCETYYSGNTFFPTEKTYRCIAMKTPFIIQGPTWFLKNLKKLGFRTFSNFWNEGYSEDPPEIALLGILEVINTLQKLTVHEISTMYNEMKPILEHNYTTLMNLTKSDFTN
jgi:hypothetical protein